MANKSETESKVKMIDFIPNLSIFTNYPIRLDIPSCNEIRKMFFPKKQNILFENAYTNTLTEKENNHIIEFRLDLFKTKKTIWIDTKYLSKPSKLFSTCYEDILNAENLVVGELWLLFFGNGYNDYAINKLKRLEHNKVKFIKFSDFEKSISEYI